MAQLVTRCATCQSDAPLQVTQAIEGGRLTWRETFACGCGHGFEAAGAGLPTPAARQALLEQDGGGEVWVDEAVSEKVLGLLCHFVSATPAELRRAVRRLPARVYSGTRTEAQFVGEAIRLAGVTSRVVPRLPRGPDATPPRMPRPLRRKR